MWWGDLVSYPRRLVWIDKQNMMPLRRELHALSGMMFKTWIMPEIEMVSGGPVARRMATDTTQSSAALSG